MWCLSQKYLSRTTVVADVAGVAVVAVVVAVVAVIAFVAAVVAVVAAAAAIPKQCRTNGNKWYYTNHQLAVAKNSNLFATVFATQFGSC